MNVSSFRYSLASPKLRKQRISLQSKYSKLLTSSKFQQACTKVNEKAKEEYIVYNIQQHDSHKSTEEFLDLLGSSIVFSLEKNTEPEG